MKIKNIGKFVVVGVFVVLGLGLMIYAIFNPSEKVGKNVVYINEVQALHKDYLVKVTSVVKQDNASILANSGDNSKSLISKADKYYVIVTLDIERQGGTKSNKLDLNDFYIKDHTGWEFKNLSFQTVKDGQVLTDVKFSKVKPLEDYEWFDSEILAGESKEITLSYEFDKTIEFEGLLMILEVDFFMMGKNSTGVDVLLLERAE